MAARDLYCSPWFRKARACVERTGRTWAILSDKYYLVWPTDTIAPYEKTLRNMPSQQRQQWADKVFVCLNSHLPGVRKVVILAGILHRQWLTPKFEEKRIKVLARILHQCASFRIQQIDLYGAFRP